MKIEEGPDFKLLINLVNQGAKFTGGAVAEVVMAVSLSVEARIKEGPPRGMPVDTGNARASWGHYTPGDVKNSRAFENMAPPIWEVEDNGRTVTQGSNVEYIEVLNAGHSSQSPAGFLDRAALEGEIKLAEVLGVIDPLSDEYDQLRYLAQFG